MNNKELFLLELANLFSKYGEAYIVAHVDETAGLYLDDALLVESDLTINKSSIVQKLTELSTQQKFGLKDNE